MSKVLSTCTYVTMTRHHKYVLYACDSWLCLLLILWMGVDDFALSGVDDLPCRAVDSVPYVCSATAVLTSTPTDKSIL